MATETEEEFEGYEPSAVDPGPALLWGTVGICSFLLVFTLCFLRRRKYCRSLKKAELSRDALPEDPTEDINENIFQKRVKKKNGRRLRGWNEIAKTIKRGKTVQVGTETRKGPTETTDVSDILGKDLFEQDGIVDKLATTLGVRFRSSDAAMSQSGSQQDGIDDGCSAASGSTGISSDYSLMSDQSDTTMPSVFQVFFSLFSNDRETKKLLKFVVPFSISALFSSSFGVLMLIAIGRVLGTQELTAYT